jgi:hypothetical protein
MGIYYDILKILLGVVIGLAIKFAIDPILKKRERIRERKEKWLEDAVRHTDDVLRHIQAIRNLAIREGGLLQPEIISATTIQALTPEYGPSKLRESVENIDSDALNKCLENVEESYRGVRIADMDLTHGAEPQSEEFSPEYAVQWYTTQLQNFAYEARKILTGK